MAGKLLETLQAPFHPAKFEDSYRERLLEYIRAKAKGTVDSLPQRTDAQDPDDLLAASAGKRRREGLSRASLALDGIAEFGLVNVPVQLVSAVRDLDLHFRQLHAKDKPDAVPDVMAALQEALEKARA